MTTQIIFYQSFKAETYLIKFNPISVVLVY